MRSLRSWLEEKRAADVKQVRVTSVLAKLDEAEAEAQEAAALEAERALKGISKSNKATVTAHDLMGVVEIADFLRVDRTRPSKWRRPDKDDPSKRTTFGPDHIPFPEPFAILGMGPVWLRSQIEPLVPFVEARRHSRSS